MKKITTAILVLAFVIITTQWNKAAAQVSETKPLYVVSHCMKSSSSGYLDVEIDLWKPVHQDLVNKGKKNSWALYGVMYGDRSKCDFYVIETYLGLDSLNNAYTDVSDSFSSVYKTKDISSFFKKTEESRVMVNSNLWVAIDSTEIKSHQFISVNWMKTNKQEDYVSLEQNIWKPVHKALLDSGHSAGWGLYALVSPYGSLVDYNYATVDFTNKLDQMPIQQMMKTVHPTKSLQEISKNTDEIRELVYRQTWTLIASTTPAKTKDTR